MLHLSLHGETTHLALEHPNAMMFPLSPALLDELLTSSGGSGILRPDGSPRIRLVVLAACKSHWAAEAFVRAGVPHVVCVEPMADVLDQTCLEFVQVCLRGSEMGGREHRMTQPVGVTSRAAAGAAFTPRFPPHYPRHSTTRSPPMRA